MDIVDHHLVGVVVDQDVNATHLLDSLVNDLLAVLLRLEVHGESVALLSFLLNHLLGVLCVLFFFGEICNEAVGSLHGEQHSDGASNARVSASNDGALALEFTCGLVFLRTALWCGKLVDLGQGVELGLETRYFLMLNIRLIACEILSNDARDGKTIVYAHPARTVLYQKTLFLLWVVLG